jgi:hypothetical protein
MRDVKTESDLARFVAKRFSNLEILMLIVDKLELLQENPFKYAREKLKNKLDKYGNQDITFRTLNTTTSENGVNSILIPFSAVL